MTLPVWHSIKVTPWQRKFCDGPGGLTVSTHFTVYAPLLAGQAARHNLIETGQANSANTMDLANMTKPVITQGCIKIIDKILAQYYWDIFGCLACMVYIIKYNYIFWYIAGYIFMINVLKNVIPGSCHLHPLAANYDAVAAGAATSAE